MTCSTHRDCSSTRTLLSADGTTAMTAVRVSPDGTFLAYALSEAGSDWRTIRVRRVDTGVD